MILGIDLGTTYSVGAYMKDDGNVEIIHNTEGDSLTPSVVMFDEEDGFMVGEVAKEHAVMCPDDVVVAIKNHMGSKDYHKQYGGEDYTPEMISSLIIRKVVQDAQLATGEKVDSVVVTVPAYFTDAKRKATEQAVTMAGVPLAGMINEPTAAALCYIKKQNVTDEKLLVYDLGGGTFDVTILHAHGDALDVLATGGISNLGGRFFDQCIVDHVHDYMEEKYDIDLEDEEYVEELQELYLKAESAKIQLSQKSKALIPLKIGKVKESITITREQFESMISRLYMRTESKVKDALGEAGIAAEDIDKVLLVGGSSRIPYIAEHIHGLVGKEPSREVNPDEAVAIGAAIYANIMSGSNENVRFEDVCSHSIGVVVTSRKGEETNEIIIPRNSKIPVSKERRFRTIVRNQKILRLTVTEGEHKELTDVTIIGGFDIQLPEGIKENTLVVIHIALNEYQLFHIIVELPEENFKQEYNIKRKANMDEETVAKVTGMLCDIAVS